MKRIAYTLFIVILPVFLLGQTYQVNSPDSTIQVMVTLKAGKPYYSVSRFGGTLIDTSRLGFILKENPSFATGFHYSGTERNQVDQTWKQPWGEKKYIRNHYNELRVNLVEDSKPLRKMALVFRVFNDGVGFRYEIPKQYHLKKIDIMDELTEFNFAGNYSCWWIPAFAGNRYEYLYKNTPLSEIDTVHTPLTMKSASGIYLSIHEAALTDYSSMTLARTGQTKLHAYLVPWSDGVKVKTTAPMISPWRTIQIADTPGGLITSYLILNLNKPNQLKDVSWIKPGKYVGIWWEMHLGIATWSSGPEHGATTENAKRYIDFASKYGFDGVLVEGWNIGWDGNWTKNGNKYRFTTPYKDYDIKEVAEYAKKHDVYLIGHNETAGGIQNYEKQMKKAFRYYEKIGIKAIKSGYVSQGKNITWVDKDEKTHHEWQHGQFMVRHYRKVVKEAAKYHLMLDVHEPIHDTGIRRTYPNMMTREGARGQEYNAWSSDGGNPPDYTTILPFTRLLAGPMDFTPGIFDLLYPETKPNNRVNTTLIKQLALYVIIYSPLQMAADLPENYEKHLDAFQFIVDVPTDWEDTKVLKASIGNYVTIVRKDRHSDNWYLGSITDETGRQLHIPLNFLDPNKTYTAEIYRDGPKADWKTNPYDYIIEKKKVDYTTELTLRLAPGGGQAIRFTPVATDE